MEARRILPNPQKKVKPAGDGQTEANKSEKKRVPLEIDFY